MVFGGADFNRHAVAIAGDYGSFGNKESINHDVLYFSQRPMSYPVTPVTISHDRIAFAR